tara:strand:- start:232 stop:1233 length:1002 start_codon:yes stop_codon:yes gene_type:complete
MAVNSYISGIGFYVPPKIVTNDDLSKVMDTSDEWIYERTGIKQRRFVEEGKGIGSADLAVPACEKAIKMSGIPKSSIDLIVFATSMPDYFIPGSSCILQHAMGLEEVGALDIRVQCSGFIYGLSIADQYIKSGMYKNILVVGSEVQSSSMDLTNRGRNVSVIFADGAGAAVISSITKGRGILSTHLHSEGKYLKELWLESPASKHSPRITAQDLEEGKQYLQMSGREVFKHAVKRFNEVIKEGLSANNLKTTDIDTLVTHQANIRISKMVQKKLELRDEQVFNNIENYGNTTAASIPIALAEAFEKGRIKNGDVVVLAAFGSGFTWGSAVIKW